MRNTRFKRYKKGRHKKVVKIIFFGFIVPAVSFLFGYILLSLIILPIWNK